MEKKTSVFLIVMLVAGIITGYGFGYVPTPTPPPTTVTKTVTETVEAPLQTKIVTQIKTVAGPTTTVTKTVTAAPTPTQTPTPAELLIEIEPTHTGYIDGYMIDRYDVVGVVFNKGNIAVTDIEVSGKFYDSDGKLVFATSEKIYRSYDMPRFETVLSPTCKVPFMISADPDVAKQVSSYSLSVTASQAINKPRTLKIMVSNIIMTEHYEYKQQKGWMATGIIKNEGPVEAKGINVMAAFYNQQGKVVGVSLTVRSYMDIPAGEELGFSLSPTNIPENETVTSVVLYAESDQSTS